MWCPTPTSIGYWTHFRSGPFFGECKEFNRAEPPKAMGLKQKIIAQYPHPHSKKKNKHVLCFNF